MSTHVVIFRARHHATDERYIETAMALRDRAIAEFGCLEFVYSTTPEGEEIALSFWPDEASIKRWKADLDHQAAQREAYARWYSGFRIQIGEISREYGWQR